MEIDQAKSEVIAALQQNSINVLVNSLAALRVENEQLKARVSELSAKPAEVAK